MNACSPPEEETPEVLRTNPIPSASRELEHFAFSKESENHRVEIKFLFYDCDEHGDVILDYEYMNCPYVNQIGIY